MNLLLWTKEFFLIEFFTFIVGTCFGSFFKLVVDRYGFNQSIVFKSSYCPSCKENLLWWQNIPIISFILLQGKCFFCKKKINIDLFFIEIATGLTTVILMYVVFTKNLCFLDAFLVFVFGMILFLLSMFDLKHREIPHFITYPAIIFIVLFQGFFNKDEILLLFLNLGLAFLLMDFLYFFFTLYKKYDLELNHISLALIVWSLMYFLLQNIYLVFLCVLLYFLSIAFNFSRKTLLLSWISMFVLFILQSYKILFVEYDINKLLGYFSGIGIVYFFCEVLGYFISSLFLKDKSETKDEPLKITIGGGDITVFALIAVFLGFGKAILVLFIASLFALISHLIYKVFARSTKKQAAFIPFVPFLTAACFIIIIAFNGNWN